MTKHTACTFLVDQGYNTIIHKGIVTIVLDEDDPRSIEEVFRIKIDELRKFGYLASFAVRRNKFSYKYDTEDNYAEEMGEGIQSC